MQNRGSKKKINGRPKFKHINYIKCKLYKDINLKETITMDFKYHDLNIWHVQETHFKKMI